jgi:hypothetical protein
MAMNSSAPGSNLYLHGFARKASTIRKVIGLYEKSNPKSDQKTIDIRPKSGSIHSRSLTPTAASAKDGWAA